MVLSYTFTQIKKVKTQRKVILMSQFLGISDFLYDYKSYLLKFEYQLEFTQENFIYVNTILELTIKRNKISNRPLSKQIKYPQITNSKASLEMNSQSDENMVFIGSNTDYKQTQSVFLYNPNKQQAYSILATINPTYILSHGKWTYVVSEVEAGEIITLDEENKILSRVSTMGSHPCHISISNNSLYLTVCNYNSASVAMYILQDNQPKKIRCFMTHEGSSINQQRQSSPHPHCSLFSPDDSILFVTDLGTDVIYYYSITEKEIKPQNQKSIKMVGTGPRTICHGPVEEKRLFVSCELDNTIRMLSYQNDRLQLVAAYRISNNPENFPSQVSYWRNEVYIALRGDDKIIVFSDEKDKLSQKIAFKVGKWPRHFVITDYGVMYISCQLENKVYRYLFKDDKILQIGELQIHGPTVVAIRNE